MPIATPRNYANSTLATDYVAGSDALVLKAGSGSLFGSPTVDAPIRVTVAQRSTLVGGQIVAGTARTVFLCTSRANDTLSGLTVDEETTDQDFTRNDPIGCLISAKTIAEIQGSLGTVTTAPAGLLKGVGGALAAAVASTDYSVPAADETFTGEKTYSSAVTHQDVVDYRGPSGSSVIRIYDPNEPLFPLDLETYLGAAGNIATGRWLDIGQGRLDNGDIAQLAASNAFNVANVEPHMFQIWPDVNGPGQKVQSAGGTPQSGHENASCIAFYNAYDLDPNFYPGPYVGQTGKKQLTIWGDGRLDWGPNLAKLPATNLTASLYRDSATNLLTMTSTTGIQLPGVKFTEGAAAGDGLHPVLTMGDVSPSVAAIFSRKASAQNIYFGESTDTGSTFFRGRGGLVATAAIASGSTYAAVQNVAGNGTSNEARLYLAPHSGFTFPDTSPYLSSYNVGNNAGFRFATYNSGMGVKLAIAPDGTLSHSGAGIGFFGGTAAAQVTGGVATAGGTYGATEQLMLQTLWNMARGYHLLT